MNQIILGHKESPDHAGLAHLDLDVFLRTRMLVQAASGQGKSHFLRRLCEQLFLAKIQTFVIDHEGEFSTLRKKFDFALIGEGGDAPADVRSAALLAQKLLEIRTSTVFDLSESFRRHPGDRRAWVKTFLASMMEAPKRLWHPVVVIVDEAHKFCPEKDEAESAEAMISVATDGRKRQFCLVAAPQRLAKFNKDAAAELLNKMIGGTSLDIDRKRAADELGVYGNELRPFNDQIKTIDRGLFWALGPAITKTRFLVKVGPCETEPPKVGTRAAAEPPPPTAKIKALLPQLADLPKIATEKAQTEAELRRRIGELERDVKRAAMVPAGVKAQPSRPLPAPVSEKDVFAALMPTVSELNARVAEYLDQVRQEVIKAVNLRPRTKSLELDLHKASRAVVIKLKSAEAKSPAGRDGVSGESTRQAQTSHSLTPPPIFAPHHSDNGDSNGKIGAGAERVLAALKQFDPDPLTRDQIVVTAGVTVRSLKDYLSTIRRRGYINERGDYITLTTSGSLAAPAASYMQTTEDRLTFWRQKFGAGSGASRILDVLADNPGTFFDRTDLESRATVTTRSMKDYLSVLRRARLIEESGRQVKASESLFQTGAL